MQGSYRSSPLGGGLTAEGGYSALLWGDREARPWFGFARAGLTGTTAGSYHAAAAFAELMPVGFFGLRIGRENSSNSKPYDGFDCVFVDCTGARTQTSAEARAACAVDEVFLILKERAEWHARPGLDSRPFAEPSSGLALEAGGRDRVRVSQILIGAPAGARTTMIAGETRFESMGQLRTRQTFIAGIYRAGDFSVLAGAGYWTDAARSSRMNVILQGTWAPLRSWALF